MNDYLFTVRDTFLRVDDAHFLKLLLQIVKALVLPLQSLDLGFLLVPDVLWHKERLSEEASLSDGLLNLPHEEEGPHSFVDGHLLFLCGVRLVLDVQVLEVLLKQVLIDNHKLLFQFLLTNTISCLLSHLLYLPIYLLSLLLVVLEEYLKDALLFRGSFVNLRQKALNCFLVLLQSLL